MINGLKKNYETSNSNISQTILFSSISSLKSLFYAQVIYIKLYLTYHRYRKAVLFTIMTGSVYFRLTKELEIAKCKHQITQRVKISAIFEEFIFYWKRWLFVTIIFRSSIFFRKLNNVILLYFWLILYVKLKNLMFRNPTVRNVYKLSKLLSYLLYSFGNLLFFSQSKVSWSKTK